MLTRRALMQIPDARRSIPLLLGAILLTFVVFAAFPRVDLWVSGLFFRGPGQFALTDVVATDALRQVIWGLAELTALGSLIAALAAKFLRQPILRVSGRIWLFLLLLFALGPGLLVNGVLKRYWGRARPTDVLEFGGERLFTPPHLWSDQCAANCSFTSGEMAGAVVLMIAIVVILWHWRDRVLQPTYRLIGITAFAIPLLTGAQRIASGRHFLSDVMFSALFVLLIAAVLSLLLFPRAKS